MKKITSYILFSFILFGICISQKTYSAEKVKTIVVFFSLDVNLPAYRGFLTGLNAQFSERPEQPYNLIVEYMDLGRFSDEGYIKKIIDLYNEKYEAVEIDMLITFGPGAYQVLKNYGLKLMQHSPTVNIDIESNIQTNVVDPSSTDEKVLHINIKTNYRKTLETAFELFPDNKKVYIICGNSPADNYFMNQTRDATEAFKETHSFKFLTGITLDSTLEVVRNIPTNSVVLIPSYIEGISRIPYSTTMVVHIISTHCNAPIFTLSDDFIEGGAIGGYVYSFIEVGKQTVKIAEEVLKGRAINEVRVDEDSFNKHMYDWRELKKWNLLDSKVIPSDSIIYNEEENFFLEYKWYLFVGILFLIGQTSLILFLIDLNKRQKAVAKQRAENEQLYRELVREDRLSRMSELTASLSHELNQPLTAILYNAQAGKRFLETGKLDDKQATEIFENIIEDDKRAGSLISSVRSLMKLEDREKGKVDLTGLIKETLKLFHAEITAKHVQIEHILQIGEFDVYGDRIQLQQVLINLLFNAANAMVNNSPEDKKILLDQQIENGHVIVSIRDSGPGIEDSMSKTLFSAFATSRAKGMGIGLAVSRTIVENHAGIIQARNHPDGGAEFTFKLQRYKDDKRK